MIVHKNMEMPSSCTMCWLSYVCDVWINDRCRHESYDKRLDNCPLIEVTAKRVVYNKQRITAYVEGGQP